MKKRVTELGKLAHQFKREGKLKQAEETYRELMNLDRYNTYALVGLGDLKRRAKRFEAAIGFYEKCLSIESDNWHALVGLGDAYRGLHDLDKALDAWSGCMKLRPQDHKTMTRIADCLKKKGDFAASKKYYLMALKKDPSTPTHSWAWGRLPLKKRTMKRPWNFSNRCWKHLPIRLSPSRRRPTSIEKSGTSKRRSILRQSP